MTATDSFLHAMEQLRLRSEEGAAELLDRFARRLLCLAHQRLHEQLRHKLDAEDVLQSVLSSFFTRYQAGGLELINWESLWGLLTLMTLRKCGNQAQHFHAARRDCRREQSLDVLPDLATSLRLPRREPTPEEAAMLTDTLAHLMQGLSPRDRMVLEWHLQGLTIAELSARARLAHRTVKRSLARIRARLCQMDEQELFS